VYSGSINKNKMNLKKIKYDTDIIISTFGLSRNIYCGVLKNWLDSTTQPELIQIPEYLHKAHQKLIVEGDFWNEEELKMQFLAHLFSEIDFNEPYKIKIFYERPLSTIVNGEQLSVICDSLLATPTGINIPTIPYFFLQEFKKGKNADDAEGQMLTAMLIAQTLNKNDKTVYGAYLQGKFWVFCTLNAQKYCVSQTFDATDTLQLKKIIAILKRLKILIMEQL
jgi:hypothetical protein